MGEIAYYATEDGKRIFEIASEVAQVDMAEVCFGSQTERLEETLIAQVAIGASHIADYSYLEKLGIRPDVGVGHSVGEIPLLAMAKIVPIRETLELMQARAVATSNASKERPGMMAAVSGLTAEQIKTKSSTILASGRTAIANFNSKTQQVFSGDHNTMEELEEMVKQWKLTERLRVRYTKLRTGGAFHSPYHMENAEGEFYEAAQRLKYSNPEFELIMNSTMYLSELGTINLPRYMSKQLVKEVDFVGSVGRLVNDGVTNFTELGTQAPDAKQKTLSGLIKRDFEELVHIIEVKELNDPRKTKSSIAT